MKGHEESPIERAVRVNAQRVSPTVAAQLLGITTRTLRNWAVQGKGPKAVRIGKVVRYEVEDINAWLKVLEDPDGVCPSCGGPFNANGPAA